MPKGNYGNAGALNRSELGLTYNNSLNYKIERRMLANRGREKRAEVIAGIKKYREELLNKSSK